MPAADSGWRIDNHPDAKVKGRVVLALARPTLLDYRVRMTSFARSLVVLLIAIFLAGTLTISAAVPSANAAATMAAMPMTATTHDCKTCDPRTDMTASCDLTCALSMAAVLAGPVTPVSALSDCRFELANATASGRVPPPAFTPPRTILLI